MKEKQNIFAKTPGAKTEYARVNLQKPDLSACINSPSAPIIRLHRTLGNMAVQRLFKSGILQPKLTMGQPNDIYEQADRVGAGRYSPETDSGKRLIAHELTHTIQQAAAGIGSSFETASSSETVAPKRLIGNNIVQFSCKDEEAGAARCGGKRTCATSQECSVPDTPGSAAAPTWWKLLVMLDTEVPSAADVEENTTGHSYVMFSNSNGTKFTYGFYPNPTTPPNIFRTRVPGCVVHPDTIHSECVDYKETFDLTQQEYSKSLEYTQTLCKAPPQYDLQTWNCTTFVVEITKRAGKSLPEARGTVGSGMFALPADNPNTLLEKLLERDKGMKK